MRPAHPLDAVAERCSKAWRPDASWPTFYLATHVMDFVFFTNDEQRFSAWAFDDAEPSYIPSEAPELFAAVLVTGGLAARPQWAGLDDETLSDLTAAQWLAADVELHLLYHDLWADARSRASAGAWEAGGRSRWAPWWRAASLWPQQTELTVFACSMEHLWRQRGDYVPPVAALNRPWLRESGTEPSVVLTAALADVLGDDPTGWPWPYSETEGQSGSDLGLTPSNDFDEPDWSEMTGLTDGELDDLLRTTAKR